MTAPHWPALRPQQHDARGLDEQHAQVAVASLGDPAQDRAAAGGVLPGHEAQPDAQIAAAVEGRSVADDGGQRMIGPTPGMVISRWQSRSRATTVSISSVTASIRASRRAQSSASPFNSSVILGVSTSARPCRIAGSCWRRCRRPTRTAIPRSRRKARRTARIWLIAAVRC